MCSISFSFDHSKTHGSKDKETKGNLLLFFCCAFSMLLLRMSLLMMLLLLLHPQRHLIVRSCCGLCHHCREIGPAHFPSVNGTYKNFQDLPENERSVACCTGTPPLHLERNLVSVLQCLKRGRQQLHTERLKPSKQKCPVV